MPWPKKCPRCGSTCIEKTKTTFHCRNCHYFCDLKKKTLEVKTYHEKIICTICGTDKDVVYLEPGKERCRACAEPIFEQLKKDRETLKNNAVSKALDELKTRLREGHEKKI